MAEKDCPRCDFELEDAMEDDEDNDFFCVNCGGLFTEEEVFSDE